jgi:hypothetical protein
MPREQHGRPAIAAAFETAVQRIALERILPLRVVTAAVRGSTKYAQIAASIAEVGIIEPPVVVRHPSEKEKFLLLDGHLRVEAIRHQGAGDVLCLVATDDEAFTYNKRISRLAAVQEHRMILNAVGRNVPEPRLAKALNIDISTLRQKKYALNGICSEAVALLSDKPISLTVFALLRRMLPLRQIEAAEMMVGMNRYTKSYVQALLAATPESQLHPSEKAKAVKGLNPDQVALMQRETSQLDREIKVVQQSFGADHLRLVLARTYVRKLIANVRVSRYLAQHQPEVLAEFQKIVEAESAAA